MYMFSFTIDHDEQWSSAHKEGKILIHFSMTQQSAVITGKSIFRRSSSTLTERILLDIPGRS